MRFITSPFFGFLMLIIAIVAWSAHPLPGSAVTLLILWCLLTR
jgi:hypothetical protein